MSTAESPEAIRNEMLQIRSEVSEDVEGIFDRAEQLTDWRYYVRRYPWACVAAAAAVGYVIVPKHTAIKVDASTVAEALRKAGVNGGSVDTVKVDRGPSWMQTGLRIVGTALMRQAAGMATRELTKFMDGNSLFGAEPADAQFEE